MGWEGIYCRLNESMRSSRPGINNLKQTCQDDENFSFRGIAIKIDMMRRLELLV